MRSDSATCSTVSPSSSQSSAWARHRSLATGLWEARYSNPARCWGERMKGAIGPPALRRGGVRRLIVIVQRLLATHSFRGTRVVEAGKQAKAGVALEK